MKSVKKYQEGGTYSGKPSVTQYFRPLQQEEMKGIRESLQEFMKKRREKNAPAIEARQKKRKDKKELREVGRKANELYRNTMKAIRLKKKEQRKGLIEPPIDAEEAKRYGEEIEKAASRLNQKQYMKEGGKMKAYSKKKKKGY